MSEPYDRMVDGSKKPTTRAVSEFIGTLNFRRWLKLMDFIDSNYPGVFAPEWQFGGKKYGWGMRLKKSKSFCTLTPERNRFNLLIVFGKDERTKVEAILPELTSQVRDDYNNAQTYHDGRWVGIIVDSNQVLNDVERLLRTKRTPRRRACLISPNERDSSALGDRVLEKQ